MRRFIAKRPLLVATFLFIALFGIVHFILKPSLIYLPDGRFRTFGVGYKHRSILTGWVAAVVLAIFCYIAVKVAARRRPMVG